MITSKDQVHTALKVYEDLRKERCEWAVHTAAYALTFCQTCAQLFISENGRGLHVADGEEQKARDLIFKSANKAG